MRRGLNAIKFQYPRVPRFVSGAADPHEVNDRDQSPGSATALTAERDAAISALERRERDMEEQLRLLTEEQDRFVSRLLESHEREVAKLRLELEEASTTAVRLEQKHERDRVASARLEEDLAHARVEMDRLRSEREAARAEARRAQQGYVAAQAAVERLQAELAFAKSMLADAMGDGPLESVQPPQRAHEVSRPPRESGIQNRRIPRPRGTPPSTRRIDTPRGLAVNANTKESVPPSSR